MTWGLGWGGRVRDAPGVRQAGPTKEDLHKTDPFKTDPDKTNPFKTDPGGRDPAKGELRPEAKALIEKYVETRDTDHRIRTSEFSRGTEIGRQLKELGVNPHEAADYARSLVGETRDNPYHERERERTDTQHEVVRRELDDDGERTNRRIEDDGDWLQIRNPRLGDWLVGQNEGRLGTGLNRVGEGALHIVNGRVVDGAGQVVVGAGEIVGGVLNEAGNLVGVQVAGGQVLMLDGRVLAAPPGGGDGQPLLYQSNGQLVPVSNASTGNPNAAPQSSFAAPPTDNPHGLDWKQIVAPPTKPGGETSPGPIPAPGDTAPTTPAPPGTQTGPIGPRTPTPGAPVPAPGTPVPGSPVPVPGTPIPPGGPTPVPGAPQGPVVAPPLIPQGTTGSSTQASPLAYDPSAAGRSGSYGGGLNDLASTMVKFVLEVLGIGISNGQARQVLAGMSPELVAAFAADPLGTLTRSSQLLSQLLAMANRGHDHGRDRTEALLHLFDIFTAKNPSAQEVYNFFTSLSGDEIAHLIAHRAEAIGNLTGVPPEVRMAANLQRIEATLADLQGARDPAAQRRAQTLERLLAENAQILHFDNAPDGRLAAGRISQVFGNLAEAKYVGLIIPGLNNTMDNFSARAERGQLLQQLAQPMVRDGAAMVVWLERLGSEVLRQYRSMLTAWQARDQARAPMTFQQALAQAARQLAQETVPGMMLRGDARLTFVGHSFGSLIAKESLNHGAKPDACVFLGVPESRLKKVAAQAGCPDTDLYALLNYGDTVDEGAAADEEPQAEDVVGPDEDVDRLHPGDLIPPIQAVLGPHDDYLLEGSPSLSQIVHVVLGRRPKLPPPPPRIITLYRSADGTFEDQAEPVGWFPQGGETW